MKYLYSVMSSTKLATIFRPILVAKRSDYIPAVTNAAIHLLNMARDTYYGG